MTISQNLLPNGDSKQTYLLLSNPTDKSLPVPHLYINGNSRITKKQTHRDATNSSKKIVKRSIKKKVT